ncbi:MAG: hypothetical protein AB8G05_26555 [Oligoflexales bacterium]
MNLKLKEGDYYEFYSTKIDELGKILTEYGKDPDETKAKNANQERFDDLAQGFDQEMTAGIKQSVRMEDYQELKEAVAESLAREKILTEKVNELENNSNTQSQDEFGERVETLEEQVAEDEEQAKKDKRFNTMFGTFYLLAGTASLYVDARVVGEFIEYNRDLNIAIRF